MEGTAGVWMTQYPATRATSWAQFSRAGAEPPPRGAISRQPACGHQEPGSEAWRGRNVGASRFREVGSREPRAEEAGEPRTEPARVGIGRKEVGDMLRKRSQSEADRLPRIPQCEVASTRDGRCEVNFVFIVTDRPTGGPLSLVFRSVPTDRPTFRRAQRGNFLTIPESAGPTDRPSSALEERSGGPLYPLLSVTSHYNATDRDDGPKGHPSELSPGPILLPSGRAGRKGWVNPASSHLDR